MKSTTVFTFDLKDTEGRLVIVETNDSRNVDPRKGMLGIRGDWWSVGQAHFRAKYDPSVIFAWTWRSEGDELLFWTLPRNWVIV